MVLRYVLLASSWIEVLINQTCAYKADINEKYKSEIYFANDKFSIY